MMRAPSSAADLATAASDAPGSVDVDPRLWTVLSAEERSFYARNAVSGPVIYGPSVQAAAHPVTGSRLGGRIDLKA